METGEKEIKKATREDAERLDLLQKQLDEYKHEDRQDLEQEWQALYMEYEHLRYNLDWDDVVFEQDGKKGMKNVKGEIVVPAIYDGFGLPESYYCKGVPVAAKKGDKAGLVKRDGTGEPVTDFEYHYMERIPYTLFYAVWKSEDLKHFALMVEDKVITPYEIENYAMPSNGAIQLMAGGKFGLLEYAMDIVYIKPEYDEIWEGGIGDEFTFIKDGKQGRVTLKKRFVTDEEFNNLPEEEQDDLHDEGFIYVPD